jgi:two-component system sensor histidine kinase PhoQ
MLQSLSSRVAVTAGVVLFVFLGSAAWVLDRAFSDAAFTAVRERLQGRMFMILGLAELDSPAGEVLPADLPEATLSMTESGNYAQILGEDEKPVWKSRSMLGLEVPPPSEAAVGKYVFEELRASTGEALACLGYTILWEGRGASKPAPYAIQVCDNRKGYRAQIRDFRSRLSLWLGGIVVGLLALQTLILRWGLKPLRQVAAEVRDIEAGEQSELSGNYPQELQALTENLNALIRARDANLQRQRNALGDLAHSLKTPLAVMRSTLEAEPASSRVAELLRDPIEQLDATIRYQLQRAATGGRQALGPSIEVAPAVERIARSLRKVYAERGLEIAVNVVAEARFFGDQGDLMEIVGNLADNACKWAKSRVGIAVTIEAAAGQRRAPLVIEISDDGPGFPPDRVAEALGRGARLDESREGHGIGLAVVREIVEDGYQGKLKIDSGAGGTHIEVRLAFV